MPSIRINNASIHYLESGEGSETLVFSHGLLMSSEMFRAQLDAFSRHYRCVAYDHRGQGESEVTEDGYNIDSLADDAAELIRHLNLAPCHFVGLSMGGFVGMRLAIRQPELLKSLVLLETSADAEQHENLFSYRMLNFVGRWFGFRIVAERVMAILFGRSFMSDPERIAERKYWKKRLIDNDRLGTTRAARAVIERKGVYEQLGQIRIPTLILVGEEDMATGVEKARRMHEAIENAQLGVLPEAGHSSTIEQPGAVISELSAFFSGFD